MLESSEPSVPEKIMSHLGEKKLSRRGFLGSLVKVVQTGVIGAAAYKTSIPEVAIHAQENTTNLEPRTDREKEGFLWPQEVRGSEAFFGGDILLTIDDCYDVASTKTMVDIMEQTGARATFFPNTQYIDTRDTDAVALWRKIYANGFDIGYHTVHHKSGMTGEQLRDDLSEYEAQMRTVLGDPEFKIQFVRPPEGNWNEDWKNWVNENNLTNVRWNFVPSAKNGSVDYFKAVMDNPDGGHIILLHPREFDTNWLTAHVSELQSLAKEQGGAITSLTNENHSD